MADYRYVNISLPEAKRLADLVGVAIDLEACRDYCDKYLQARANLTRPTNETRHLECFSVYVFVKYGRCFKGGVRRGVEKELETTLSGEDLVLHQLIIDIRDKYIAHSVNELESHKVRVWLNPQELGKKINNVNVESHYLAGPETALFERLKCLVDKLVSWLEVEKRREEESLTLIVQNRYDLNELYSLDAKAPDNIDYSKVARPRRTP
jgi:hypothetical protein